MGRTKEVARMSTGGSFPSRSMDYDAGGTNLGKSFPSWAVIAPTGGVKKPLPKAKLDSQPKQKPTPTPAPKPQRYCPARDPIALRSGKGKQVNEVVNNYQVISDDDNDENDDEICNDLGSGLGSGSGSGSGLGSASPQVTFTGSGSGFATPQSNASSPILTSDQSQSMEPRPESLSLLTFAAEQMQRQDGGCLTGSCIQTTAEDAIGSVSQEVVEDPNPQRDEVFIGPTASDNEDSVECGSGDEHMHDVVDEEPREVPVGNDRSNVFQIANAVSAPEHTENGGAAAGYNGSGRGGQQCATSSLNLTGMADLVEENDATEVNSVGCDGRVSVIEYRVKPQNAELLRRIISRYGDIGANCALASVAARSFFMELVCETLRELMTTDLTKMTENKIQNMKASLGDVEKEQIRVGWLKTRLDEILEAKLAMPLLKPSSNLRRLREECETKIRTLKGDLTVYVEDLSIKMNEIHTLRQKIDATLRDVSEEEDQAKKLDLTISECKAKIVHLAKLETLASDLV